MLGIYAIRLRESANFLGDAFKIGAIQLYEAVS